MGYALPLPHRPMPGESLASVIVRNAERYHFHNPMRVLRRIGSPTAFLATLAAQRLEPDFSEALRTLLGLDEATFESLAYATDDESVVRFNGHRLHHELVTTAFRRWCPNCLEEAAYHRQVWDLSLVTVCPVHGVRLLDRCPRCGHRPSWQTGQLLRCPRPSCRFDLRQAATEPVDDASLGGMRALVDIALAGADAPRPLGLGLGELMRLCLQLGIVARGINSHRRPIAFATNHPEIAHQVLDTGWNLVTDWPVAFHGLLGRLRADATAREGRYGLAKQFGTQMLGFLQTMPSEPYGDLVTAAFEQHVASIPGLSTRSTGIRRHRTELGLEDQFVTLSDAADRLHVGNERMRELADTHDLYMVAPTGKGAATVLDAERLKTLVQSVAGQLTKQDTYLRLGLGKKTFVSVEAANLVPTVPQEERLLIEYPYRVADVDAFLARLEAAVRPDLRPRGKLVPLRSLTRQGKTMADLLRAVLDGSLVPVAVAKKGSGVARLLFPVVSLARAFGPAERTMSVTEAAVGLGAKEEAVYHWVRKGFLRTVQGTSRWERGRRVTPEGLADFSAQWYFGTKTPTKKAADQVAWRAKDLLARGVTPVSGPSVDGGLWYLFRRAEVEALSP